MKFYGHLQVGCLLLAGAPYIQFKLCNKRTMCIQFYRPLKPDNTYIEVAFKSGLSVNLPSVSNENYNK